MEEARNAILNAELAAIRAAGLERSTDRPTRGIDFTSNDYLGLSQHPGVVEAGIEALRRCGAGAGAARLLAGPLQEHVALEEHAAQWLGSEASLLFPSGFQANHGVLGVLSGPADTVHSDRLIHASLIDAARASRATVWVHEHLDLDHLERDLRLAQRARRRIVVTEGIFGMDGDAAPLAELCELCLRHDAWLVVDEAHSAGLVGPAGAGLTAAAAIEGAPVEAIAARIATGGKALGVGGALVAGSRALRELMVNRARPFVFTTAPPPSLAASLKAAIDIAASDSDRRQACLRHARAIAAGLDLPEPAGAIVPAIIPGNAEVTGVAQGLESQGFGVRAVRSPTVPVGSERLRLVAHSFNGVDEIERLVEAVRDAAGAPLAPPPPPLQDAGAGGSRIGHRGEALGTLRTAPAFVVAGTDTDVGKTVLSAIGMSAIRRLGPAGYWKPVQTGDDDDTETVRRLTEEPGCEFAEPLLRLPLPASPHEAAAAAGTAVPVGELTPALQRLLDRDESRRWIVELAGGLLVPYRSDRTQLEWLREIRFPLLMAARSGLGTLNHTLLSVSACERAGVPIAALFLIGERHPSNLQTLIQRTRVAHVFEVRRFDALGPEAIEGWLDGAVSHAGQPLEAVLADALVHREGRPTPEGCGG